MHALAIWLVALTLAGCTGVELLGGATKTAPTQTDTPSEEERNDEELAD